MTRLRYLGPWERISFYVGETGTELLHFPKDVIVEVADELGKFVLQGDHNIEEVVEEKPKEKVKVEKVDG